MRPSRLPIRIRLTALYAAAFLAAGVALVAMTYWLVSRSLEHGDIGHAGSTRPATGSNHRAADQLGEAIETYRIETLDRLMTWSILALVAAMVLAVSLGWVLAGRALRPLRRVTDTATRVADQSLHERIALEGPNDEIKELADTIDAMLERLDRSFDAQRRFVANASHELLTPLAMSRTMLEVAAGNPEASDDLRGLAPDLLATNSRSERLVDGLLTLARSEQVITDRAAIDLAAAARIAVEQEQHEALDHDVSVRPDLEPAPTVGNPILVERLATNLVQNAVRHSPRGAVVHVRTRRTENQAVLLVENPGPQLPPDEIEGLFEPFQRGQGRTRSQGAGLGLSIVRSVARAHGGHATARPRPDGGLIVRVELPPSTNH